MHRLRRCLVGVVVLVGAGWSGTPAAASDCLLAPCPAPLAPAPPPDEQPEEAPAQPAEDAPEGDGPAEPEGDGPAEPQPAPRPEPTGGAPAPPPPGTVDEAAAQRLLALMNEERRQVGAPPLARRADVDAVARDHSRQMAAAGRIWHHDAYFSSASRKRLDARRLGENVALNGSVEDAHRRLMASPGHRRNILDPGFTVVGVGVVRGDDAWYLTEDFVEPRTQPATGAASAARAHDRRAAAAPTPRAEHGVPGATPEVVPTAMQVRDRTAVPPALRRAAPGVSSPTAPPSHREAAGPEAAVVAGAALVASGRMLRRALAAGRE